MIFKLSRDLRFVTKIAIYLSMSYFDEVLLKYYSLNNTKIPTEYTYSLPLRPSDSLGLLNYTDAHSSLPKFLFTKMLLLSFKLICQMILIRFSSVRTRLNFPIAFLCL